MYLQSILLSTLVCYCSSHQAHPPGIPPQQQQQVHHQEMAAQGGQNIPHPGGHQDGFRVNAHDAEHIKEHLKDVVEKPKEEMTEEELEFHYFKLHDYDSNNKLDGTEITKAITHFHEEEGDQQANLNTKVFSDEEIANIVDMVLKEDDLNGDGYIEYVEFVTAQRKAKGNN